MSETWICGEIKKLSNDDSAREVINNLYSDLIELRKLLNELRDLFDAFRRILPKRLNDINDDELKQRLITVIAGGITSDDASRSFARFMYDVFGVGVRRSGGLLSFNEGIEYVIKYGDAVTVDTKWNVELRDVIEEILRRINDFIYYLRELKIINKENNESISYGKEKDDKYYISLIKKYVPSPNEKPKELIKLLIEIRRQLIELTVGSKSSFLKFLYVLRFIPLVALLRTLQRCLGLKKIKENTFIKTLRRITLLAHNELNIYDVIKGESDEYARFILRRVKENNINNIEELLNKHFDALIHYEGFYRQPYSLIYSLIEYGIKFEEIIWGEGNSVIREKFKDFVRYNLKGMKEYINELLKSELGSKIKKKICQNYWVDVRNEEVLRLVPLAFVGLLDICLSYHNYITIRLNRILSESDIRDIVREVNLCE